MLSFSSRGFLLELPKIEAELALYLELPNRFTSLADAKGISFLSFWIWSINDCLLDWVVAHRGAVFLNAKVSDL